MIKEILLSLAVAAFSGVSSFVGSPKKAALPSKYYNFSGVYSVSATFSQEGTADYSGPVWYGEIKTPMYNRSVSFGYNQFGTDLEIDYGGDWNSNLANAYRVVAYSDNSSHLNVSFYWGSFNSTELSEWDENFFSWRSNFSTTGGAMEDEALGEGDYYYQTIAFSSTGTASFILGQPTYRANRALINCTISSTPDLPNTYTQTGQTYTIYGQANEDLAGSYGFNSSSLTLTGVTTSNFELTNEIGNSGLYRGCSFSIKLPTNDITIRLEAFRPSYSIAYTLNHCSVSPSVPGSYSGLYAEDFTFTAESGYAFNSLAISWEFSANITAQEPTFSNRLYGSLYEKVTFRLVFENGNCEFRMTAAPFSLDSYSEGYDNGYSIGYDKGHADGLIAGDSYGVWNWLKQAARTTGEFLSIPLLPGFSIGGLLTALAGLMIIWLFIKGFLFKS